MTNHDFPDCMSCGEPLEECSCPGCEVCGAKTCVHLRERAETLLRLLGQSIRDQLLVIEEEGK